MLCTLKRVPQSHSENKTNKNHSNRKAEPFMLIFTEKETNNGGGKILQYFSVTCGTNERL